MGSLSWVNRLVLLAAAAIAVAAQESQIGAAQEQGGSAKAVLERYNLLGIFAADCGKPVSPQNPYVMHRAVDDQRVQRDTMTGPTTRTDASMIDSASVEGPDQLMMSMANERRRLNVRLRVEGGRWQLWESVDQNGQRLVSDGRIAGSAGVEMPWLSKCTTQ
jgi:hypothetical protein